MAADPRIISVTVVQQSGSTHFNIRWSADGGVTWTPYSTQSLTPSSPEDLSVSLLDGSSSYLLDGVNSPPGNAALASADGNLYEVRLKSAGGYGNWSVGFEAVVPTPPPGWPVAAEVLMKLAPTQPSGLSATAIADIEGLLLSAEAEFESLPAPDGSGGTGRHIAPVVLTRTFYGGGRIVLPVPEFVPAAEGGTAPVITADGVTVTGAIAVQRTGRMPWDGFTLPAGASISRWPATADANISIAATWGWASSVPRDVWNAVRSRVAASLLPGVAYGQNLGIVSWHDADRTVAYNPEMFKHFFDAWQGEYERTVARYRDQELLFRIQTAGLPGFGRRYR